MAIARIDGDLFRAMVRAAVRTLEANKDTVNALNVFPVPDGDTGANMSMTLSAAAREVDRVPGVGVGGLAQAMAQGSLMGARGNSGVILSQLFRGFARVAAERPTLTPREMATALQEAADTAYRAVMKPVEGTILTVAREAAAAAVKAAARQGASLATVMERVVEAAEMALAQTPNLLPVLKKAGVVDAGGKGFCCILAGYRAAVQEADGAAPAGQGGTAPASQPDQPAAATGTRPAAVSVAGTKDASPAAAMAFQVDEEIGDIRFPYDTELFIRGTGIPLEQVQGQLEPLGDCVYVVGTAELAKVHIHTDNPGPVLGCCIRYGELIQIEIKNMREQYEDLLSRSQPSDGAAPLLPVESVSQTASQMVTQTGPADDRGRLPADPGEAAPATAVVSVAAGAGLETILHSLGAASIVSGGQTMNPSTEEILGAVEATGAEIVYVLPNNKNIILAAQQAAELASRQVFVVPSRSIPQGVAALLAWQPDGDPQKMYDAMVRTLDQVETGEITYAVRDTVFGDLAIHAGDILGLWNGEINVTGTVPEDVLCSVLARMVAKIGGDVITVYYGEDVTGERAETLGRQLHQDYPHHEVEVQMGGQPLYYYLFSVE